MRGAVRTHLTSGIAALGVGAIALSPVQLLPTQLPAAPQRAVESLAVNLAATIDPITPWVDTFKTAAANVKTLVEFYNQDPLPLLKTIGANLKTYSESGDLQFVVDSMKRNLVTFFEAPWSPGDQAELPSPPLSQETKLALGTFLSETRPVIGNSPADLNSTVLQAAVGQMLTDECEVDGNCLAEQAAPVLNFLNTPYSGQLIGLIGTMLSPLVQLTRSFTAVGEYFKAGNVAAAINELINIPANTTNAFLNGGGYLDLTAIVTKILPLPVDYIGLNLGGLLTSTPRDGSLADPETDPPTKWSGGAGLDGVATKLGIEFGGIPLGWSGAVVGLGQYLAKAMLVEPPTSAQVIKPAKAPAAAASVAAPVAQQTQAAALQSPEVPSGPEAPPAPQAPAAPLSAPDEEAPVVAEAPAQVEEPVQTRGANGAAKAGEGSATKAGDDSVAKAGDNGGGRGGPRSGARGHRGAA